MSYKSPIDLYYHNLQKQVDEEVIRACYNVGVFVNKDELVRALQYDREQYRKGYRDAREEQDLISRSALIQKIFPYGMPDDGNYGINAKAVMRAIEEAE